MATPAIVTDINALFTQAYTRITQDRVDRSLPPLNPNGLTSFQIGEEYERQNQDAPRIILVPTRCEYGYISQQPQVSKLDRKQLYTRWMLFEAHIWGNPDYSGATPVSPYFDFNSTMELEREFLAAMYSTATGGSFRPDGADWVQLSHDVRRGRVLSVTFRVATMVTDTPWTALPYSKTPGDGGVTGQITVNTTAADGTSIETVGIINAPPPIS